MTPLSRPRPGWIEVITGSMFSGKSEELIRRVRRAQIARQKVQLFKPRMDDRHAGDEIVSHSDMKMPSQVVASAREMLERVEEGTEVVAIDEGQFVSIVGPNGAGKTTLVNVLTGLIRPSAGTVRFKGEDIAGIGPVKLAALGMARSFQLVNIFPALTVAETIAVAVVSQLGRGLRWWSALPSDAQVKTRVNEVADLFGFGTKLGLPARTLSQGDKKLLDVASAFALMPHIILLDEPTSSLDSEAEAKVQAALEVLMRGRTVLMIAHRLSTVKKADLICVLDQGRIVETGRHDELVAKGGLYTRLHRTQFGIAGGYAAPLAEEADQEAVAAAGK